MALTFDGVNEVLTCTTLGSFGGAMASSKPTVAMWINTTSTAVDGVAGTYNDSSNTHIMCIINQESDGTNTAGCLRGYLRDEDGNAVNFGKDADTGFNDGAWHSLIWSFDGPNNTGYIWLDGVAQAIAYTTQTTPDNFANFIYPMMVAAWNNVGTAANVFTGSLADVRFYNRLFTDTDAAIYHYEQGADCILNNLVARYALAAGVNGAAASGTIPDLSGNGYHATVVNTPDWLAAPLRICKPPMRLAD